MASEIKKPSVQSFGCRLNIWESEVISRHSEAAGLADTVIINTCAVTAEAEKQARQAVRKQRRDHPNARIVVTGCSAQIDPSSWRAMAEVDAVIGNHEKLESATWQAMAGRNSPEKMVSVGDIMSVRETAPHLLEGFDNKTRAFLQVQQGCDHRCTFCIIPYGRGNNRSVSRNIIIDQVKLLADAGIAEVVLTGVDIASWGSDLDGQPKLGQLVRSILSEVPLLPRLRLSSIDPAEIDSDLLAALAEEERLMPHLHLSVQHGDDLILKRMKRRHLSHDVQDVVDTVRKIRPDCVFGADLIAGFPTEDDTAHGATLDLIKKADLTWLHVFPYSPRQGTPAARMPQVEGQIIRQRAAELRQSAVIQQKSFLERCIGTKDEMLLETGGIGHTRGFARARLMNKDHALEAGKVYSVKITGVDSDILEAEMV